MKPGDKDINVERMEEVIASGANMVAANCPFFIIMLSEGAKAKNK